MRDREYVIHLHLPRWPRRRTLAIIAAAVVLSGTAVYAAFTYNTGWIGSGQPVSATNLQHNLDELYSHVGALETARAGVKSFTIANATFSPNSFTNIGAMSFTPPAAGQVLLTVTADTFGSSSHVTGVADRVGCCLSNSAVTCSGNSSVSFDVPPSWPTQASGPQGIEFPFSLTGLFPYSGTGALSMYLNCNLTTAAGSSGAYIKGMAATALYVPATY
jgi:hypothetical protein